MNYLKLFEEFDEELPFTATSYDPMPHGVDLYNRAKAGEFGVIAEYVPPPVIQPTTEGTQEI